MKNPVPDFDLRNPELCVHARTENDDLDLICYLGKPRLCGGPCEDYEREWPYNDDSNLEGKNNE